MVPAQMKVILLVYSCLLSTIEGAADLNFKTSPSLQPDAGGEPQGDNQNIRVTFDCKGREKGYYGDTKFGCTIFHYCSNVQKRYSYKCNDGKKFDEMTSSCIYYLGEECKAAEPGNTVNPPNKRSRDIKYSFPGFPHHEMRNEISQAFSSSEGIGTLSAFASLVHNNNQVFPTKLQDTSYSGSENIFEMTERTIHNPKENNKYEIASNNNRRTDESLLQERLPKTSKRVSSRYKNVDLKSSGNQLHLDRRFYSPPVYHAQKPKNIYNTANHIPQFQNSESHQHPALSRSTSVHPISHINFTPPGSKETSHHTVSHSKNAASFQSFHSPTLGKTQQRPKPHSVFRSPTHSPLPNSTPKFQNFVRSPDRSHDIHIPQFYEDHSSFSGPYSSTPVYYDYDLPYYQTPIPIPDHYYPYDPSHANYPHQNVPSNLPLSPNQYRNYASHSISNPGSQYVTDILRNNVLQKPLHQNIISTTQKTINNPRRNRVRRPHVSRSPILPVSTLSPEFTNQFESDYIHETTDNENYDYDYEIAHNVDDRVDIEVTTYAPTTTTTPKIIKSIKPKVSSATKFNKHLTSRRRIPASLRINRPVSNHSKKYKEDDLKKEITTTEKTINQQEITSVKNIEQEKVIEVNPIQKDVKPSVLRGGLKQRLNRLGTRTRINQNLRLRQTHVNKQIEDSTPKVERKPLKRPSSLNTKKVEDKPIVEAISPASIKEHKKRISNFFKNRPTPSRRNNLRTRRPVSSRLKENNTESPVIKKSDEDNLLTEKIVNIEEVKLSEEETKLSNKEKITKKDELQITTKAAPPATPIKSRKRPMSPDVRSRFKEFLKNRKAGNRINRKPQKKKLLKESANSVQKDHEEIKEEQKLSKEKKIDAIGTESEIMEKSVPLYRTESIVSLANIELPEGAEDRSDNSARHFQNFVKDSTGSYTNPVVTISSTKPLRYLINRSKMINDYRLQQQRIKGESTNTNQKAAPTAVTNHRIVQPTNFKQIVNMSPRVPVNTESSVILENGMKISDSVHFFAGRPKLNIRPTMNPTTEKNLVTDGDRKQYSHVTPSYKNLAKEFRIKEKPTQRKRPMNRHREKSRPVFNLDIIEQKDERPHLSALESTVGDNAPSDVHFEPFSFDAGSPMLPLEKLLNFT